jgi:diguanylate cyclase (GGDEF)-like protein/PAS domain S-box-containing protein
MPDDRSTLRAIANACRWLLRAGVARRLAMRLRVRRRSRWGSSIGVRLALLVLALGLPFIVYVGVSTARQAAVANAFAKQRALAVARAVAGRVDDLVADNLAALALLRHGVTADAAASASNEAFLASMRTDLPRLVHNVGVWTLDGRSAGVLNRAATPRAPVAGRAYFRAAAQGSAAVIEGPIAAEDDGTPVVVFASAIVGAAGEVEGVVTLETDLRQVEGRLDLDGAIPRETVIAIVNAEGIVLARSVDSARWIGRSVLGVGRAREHMAQREGVDETSGGDGVARIAGFTQTRRTRWHVFVGMPADAVLSAARVNVLDTVAFGGLSLLLGALVSAWLGARIARPLRRLAYDATLLARGNLSHRTEVAGDDETGVLATTLNRLAQTVEERTRALQEKTAALEDKTAALERSSADLVESERRMRMIADNLPPLIAYLSADERYRFVNARCEQIFGLSPSQMIGRTVQELISPEGYAQSKPHLDRVRAGSRARFQRVVVRNGRTCHELVELIPDRDDAGSVQGFYALVQDISDLREAQEKAEQSEQRLRSITDSIPSMVGYIDRERRYRFNNRYYETWLSRPLAEITGRRVDDVLGPAAYANVAPNLDRAFRGERVDFDVEVPGPAGSRFVRGSYIPHLDDGGQVIGVYTSSTDITPLKVVERQLERLAQKDTLTGLANRHAFNDGIVAALRRSQRSGTQVALLFLDVDAFKRINDTLGHAAGDEVLREFARRLSSSVRATDLVARLAGDEFVIVLEGIHSRDECRFVARKIIAAMRAPFPAGDVTVKVTTSIGIALGHGGGTTAEALLKRADSALYAAKGQGRDRFEIAI